MGPYVLSSKRKSYSDVERASLVSGMADLQVQVTAMAAGILSAAEAHYAEEHGPKPSLAPTTAAPSFADHEEVDTSNFVTQDELQRFGGGIRLLPDK
jgi:hypothetical protein